MPQRIRVQRIFFDTEQRARDALDALRQGAAFEEYKRQHPQKKITLDSLWLQQRDGAFALEQAAFKLMPGQVSDVYETKAGYCLMRLEQVADAREPAFAEIKQRIQMNLQRQREQALVTQIRAELRQGGAIRIDESTLENYRCSECP